MSNPTTYYTVRGVDLSGIFQPLSSEQPYPYATGYKIPDGRDLNQIFASKTSSTIGYNTGYDVSGTDLQLIFAPYVPTFISVTTQNDYIIVTPSTQSGYTIWTFENTNLIPGQVWEPGLCDVTFATNKTINIILIGGGGGGGFGSGSNGVIPSSGGGGGGGGYLELYSIDVEPNISYNLTVGSGGISNSSATSNANGQQSIFSGGALNISAAGGNAGESPATTSSQTGGQGTGNGGGGGNPSTSGANGANFPTEYGYSISYGGGGGGGINQNTNGEAFFGWYGSGYGGSGMNGGAGGILNTSNPQYSVGSGYGAGGGGGGGSTTMTNGWDSGNGSGGLVILYWT